MHPPSDAPSLKFPAQPKSALPYAASIDLQVADAGLQLLARCSHLRRLRLVRLWKVTAAGLQPFTVEGAAQLRFLDLSEWGKQRNETNCV